MQKYRNYTKEQKYALIKKYEQSGLSQRQFYNQYGIPGSTFAYWRKKHLKEACLGNGKNGFIPVKVDKAVDKSQQVIELVYPNGVRMLCPADIDLSFLKSLIVL